MVSLQTRVRSRAHDDPERQTTDDLFLCYVPSRDSGESHLGGGSTHAWCQIYLPGSGWVEFDPTNGIVGNRDLIRVALARDARQASPLHGSYFRKVEDEEEWSCPSGFGVSRNRSPPLMFATTRKHESCRRGADVRARRVVGGAP